MSKDNAVISYRTAVRVLDLLLNSPGRQKSVIIYGGEPLLYFNLLKKILIFLRNASRRTGKQIICSVGTNGLLLDRSRLEFFRRYGIKLAISIDGRKRFHDRSRVFPDGEGSFDAIIRKIPLILEHIRGENLCVLFGVLPSSAEGMYDNLLYLLKLGFENINIEPIHSRRFVWTARQKKVFLMNMERFCEFLYCNISKDNFIFLNTVNRQLKDQRLSGKKNNCPFFENLEVNPHGEIAFSPFLINSRDKKRYIIGEANKGIRGEYASCCPGMGSCLSCWERYAGGKSASLQQDVLKIRDIVSIYLARSIADRAGREPLFKRYLAQAKKRSFE